MENVLEQQLMQAAQMVEQQVDAEINKLEHMDEDDFEKLRQKRLNALKKQQQQKMDWMQKGHGTYEEIPDEKSFFDVSKQSKNVICHFYRDSTFRCKIVDKHLAILAPKHIEARFVKLNVEKCKFLVDRLKIKVLPNICLVKEGKTMDYIVGFDDLGGTDEFSTEMLEWRIARSDVIRYSGDLLTPPDAAAAGGSKISFRSEESKKTIRGRDHDDDSTDDDE